MVQTPALPARPAPVWRRLGPRTRRVVQVALYEAIAIVVVALALALVFNEPGPSAVGLSVLTSGIAVTWNYAFNTLFERWERRQPVKGRSWQRRVAHGLGFEGGLTVFLVPVMAWWLDTTLWLAFLADLGLLLFFLVYTVVFTWCFDQVFGLPQSALSSPD
ncbi:PACE efflux transporter [Macromonas nakdongensis]|uniref:PACE efflux transporter n=1 Tax=Macromonas nakdongensis TaxID=1843082 RepID=UPI0012FF22E9|nr:PACE efflux transporter [Macromonas nakdongensis]